MHDFYWTVSQAGHGLIPNVVDTAGGLETRDFKWIEPGSVLKGWRRYAPLQNNALFLNFANLDDRPASILGFANRFGLLTDPERGEPISTWTSSIASMRRAVELWNASPILVPHHGSRDWLSSSVSRASPLNSAEQDQSSWKDNLVGAKDPVLAHPDADHVSALEELGILVSRNIANVRPVFGEDSLEGRLKLHLIPTNLLEAMWLQLGQAIEFNKKFRKCRQCETWFSISHREARSDKQFCTEACKAKGYRQSTAGSVRRATASPASMPPNSRKRRPSGG